MGIRVLGLDHIHVETRDLKRARDLVARLFDVDATHAAEMPAHGFVNVSMMLRGAPNQPFLDMFQSTRPDGFVGRTFSKKGPGVSYLSFRVENLDEAAAHAASLGLEEVSRVGYRSMRQVQFDTLEPLGFMLEFVEYGPGFWEEQASVNERLARGEEVEGLRWVDL